VSLENKPLRRLNETEDEMATRFTMYSLLFAVQGALALDGSGAVDNSNIITFDVPGAGTVPAPIPAPPGFFPQGTFPYGVNDKGAIGGNFQDGNNVLHGFLRTSDGTFIVFDAPGAGKGAFQGTQGFAISSEGTVVGKTFDANFVQHGMLRTREGTVTVFEAPGAGTGAGQGTFALTVNAEGTIGGTSVDANNVFHGFLRVPDGSIISIDAPGAGTGAGQGSGVGLPVSLTDGGAIVGTYVDANNVPHGFLRSSDGVYTTIDVPAAGTGAFQGTGATGINEEGTIVGGYTDANGLNHGYVRARDGTITTFDVPAAGMLAGQGTIIFTASINREGVITGNYLDVSNVSHGFVRDEDGTITTFDAPGAGISGNASLSGTTPIGNNARNWITGYYFDANGVGHGFLRTGRGRH
jgi:hypothetical protein